MRDTGVNWVHAFICRSQNCHFFKIVICRRVCKIPCKVWLDPILLIGAHHLESVDLVRFQSIIGCSSQWNAVVLTFPSPTSRIHLLNVDSCSIDYKSKFDAFNLIFAIRWKTLQCWRMYDLFIKATKISYFRHLITIENICLKSSSNRTMFWPNIFPTEFGPVKHITSRRLDQLLEKHVRYIEASSHIIRSNSIINSSRGDPWAMLQY